MLRQYRGADKSLARPGRKQATATKLSCKPLKNNSEGCPSNQVSAAGMTSASEEKWRPFNCFFSRVGLRTYQHPCKLPLSLYQAHVEKSTQIKSRKYFSKVRYVDFPLFISLSPKTTEFIHHILEVLSAPVGEVVFNLWLTLIFKKNDGDSAVYFYSGALKVAIFVW